MSKTLKFKPHLAEQIRQGTKVSTWRLFDDKDLQDGDVVGLIENGIEAPFATARITKTAEKTLGSLQEEDWVGHERFASDEEMYATFRKYYGPEVGPETVVKIIWFSTV
ncbi:MAG: ASCH domain-containing protein [bacterium]